MGHSSPPLHLKSSLNLLLPPTPPTTTTSKIKQQTTPIQIVPSYPATISPNTKPDPEEHEPKRHRYALPTPPDAHPQTRAQQPNTTLQQTDHRMMIKSTKTCPNSASFPNQKPPPKKPRPPPPPRSQGPSNPRSLPPTDSAPRPLQHPPSAVEQKPG